MSQVSQEYLVERESLTAIADEIRTLSGTTSDMSLDAMANNVGEANNEVDIQSDLISQIQTALQNKASATPTLQTKTVTPTTSSQNVTPDSGYDGLSKVTVNAIPNTYVKPTTTKAATTYTPTTSNQTIAAGTYCSGAQTIKGDANLVPANIAEGVSIFGVTGTHSGGSVTTDGWTAVSSLPTTYAAPSAPTGYTYYMELPEDVNYVLFVESPGSNIYPLNSFIVYWKKQSLISNDLIFTNTSTNFTINDVSTDGSKILELVSIDYETAGALYFFPIYNRV